MVSEFLDDDSINPKPIEIVMTVRTPRRIGDFSDTSRRYDYRRPVLG